jgi:hypothetical protein
MRKSSACFPVFILTGSDGFYVRPGKMEERKLDG